MSKLVSFFKDESGATAIEYGLIAGLIAIGLVTVLGSAGGSLQTMFSTVSSELDAAAGTTGP